MNDEIRTVFGSVADRYDRARPGYPTDAAAWLAGDGPLVVLELGAGTGKLTAELVGLGHGVHATDPDPRMLAVLQERLPGVRTTASGAEKIPAADQSVDVVVCGQSFHWFDHERALPEITRVLRHGGVLALVWNERDESTPWVRRLGGLIGRHDVGHDPMAMLGPHSEFGFVEEREFRHWHELRRQELLDLAASRSNVASLAEEERAELLTQVGELFDDVARSAVRLPYLTRCFRTTVQHRRTGEHDDVEHSEPLEPPEGYEDTGTLLIDFR